MPDTPAPADDPEFSDALDLDVPPVIIGGGLAPLGPTPGGLPYPDPSAPVSGGADAIRALALALDPAGMSMGRLEAATVQTTTWTHWSMTRTIYTRGGAASDAAGGIRVTAAGLYSVSATADLGGAAGGTRRGIGVGQQDAIVAGWPRILLPPSGSNAMNLAVAGTVYMAAGQRVGLFLFQDSPGGIVATTAVLTVVKVA